MYVLYCQYIYFCMCTCGYFALWYMVVLVYTFHNMYFKHVNYPKVWILHVSIYINLWTMSIHVFEYAEYYFCHILSCIYLEKVVFVNFVKLWLKMSYIFYMIALRKQFVHNTSDDISRETHCKTLCNPVDVVHAKRPCEFLHECFELRNISKLL